MITMFALLMIFVICSCGTRSSPHTSSPPPSRPQIILSRLASTDRCTRNCSRLTVSCVTTLDRPLHTLLSGLGLWASLARESATNKGRSAERLPKLSDLPFVDLARVLSPFIAKTLGAQPASGT